MSSAAVSARSERIVGRRLPLAALVGGVAAAVANLIVFFIAQALGVSMTGPFGGPTAPPTDLPAVAVIVSSFVPAFIGAGLLWLLNRFTPRPITIFVAISAIVAVLSIGSPATLPVSTGLIIALSLMHFVAAAAIVWALVTRARA
jgi:hypothetical protein